MSTLDAAAHTSAPDKITKVTRAGAIGNFIEFYDFTLYGFFAVTIATLFFPQFDSVAALLSTFALFGVAFVIRPIGAVVFGHIGDRWGRKRALMIAVLLMSGATAAIGVLPTYAAVGVAAPTLLLVCRLLQGFSAGGEQSGAFVLVVEQSAIGERGRNASKLVVSIVAGVCCAALVVLVVSALTTDQQMAQWGWRLPFLLSAPLGVLGFYLRMSIEDSHDFTAARANSEPGTPAPLAQAFRTVRRQMCTLLGWVAMQSVAGYILVGFMMSYLVKFQNYPMSTALTIVVVGHFVGIGLIFGIGRWADRIQRKTLAVSLAAALAIAVVPAFILLRHGVVAATIGISLYATTAYSLLIVSALAVVELFPVEVRYSASALPFQISYAVFGGAAPFVSTWLVAEVSTIAPAYALVLFGILGIVVAAIAIPNLPPRPDDGADGTAADRRPGAGTTIHANLRNL
ncbi:MFS transporter [Rhodococcus opacus]|uniref:MFS transporter n=1 Tax=Rhodococcus opacus TaxID=37919 RepID=UPI002953580D|nr:MFS transporter [Rhodococcus opacus]MDV7089330.1 MFS transporter [Rhodococcus opacus]